MISNDKLKMAVSLALASAALAGPVAQAAVTTGEVLRVGGATATDRSLAKGWIKDMCDAATTPASPGASAGYNVEVYTTNNDFLSLGAGASDVTQNYAIACRTKTIASPAAQTAGSQQDVVMVKFSGGSSTGVAPVASGSALASTGSANWVNFSSCRDPATGAALGAATREEIPAAGGLPNIVLYTGCAEAGAQVTKAGVADLEPKLIVSGGAGLALTSSAGASIPMGVAVSSNLFEALQVAQGLTGCTEATYNAACTPSLSTAQIAGIYKGNLIFATQLKDASGVALTAPAGGNDLRVCRRGDGSGTQRSHAVHFLGQRCGSALSFVAPANAAGGSAWTIGSTIRVFAGTGAGDVTACMDDSVTTNRYAVGLLSLESNNFNSVDQRWRFVKIDGRFPSLEEVNNGNYNFFVESSCNAPSTSNLANTLTAVQRALATGGIDGTGASVGLCGAIRGETATVTNNAVSWRLGTLSIPRTNAAANDPTPATPWTSADIDTNPTNTQTRAASFGGAVNNCNQPYTGQTLTTPPDLPTN